MSGTEFVEDRISTTEGSDERVGDRQDGFERDNGGERPAPAEGTTEASVARVDGTVERSAPGRLWTVPALVGVAALAVAVTAVAFPGLIPVPEPNVVRSTRSFAMLLATFGGMVGLYLLYDGRGGIDRPEDGPFDLPAPHREQREPESDASPDLVGSDIDDLVGAVDGRVDPYSGLEASYAADVRRELRETVVTLLVDRRGCSAEQARRQLDDGTWTDDRRASSFLGDETVPDPPLGVQLRDWASGEAFDRRVEATVAEIRRLADGGDRR